MKIKLIWHPKGKRKQKTFSNACGALDFYNNHFREIRRSLPIRLFFFINKRWIPTTPYNLGRKLELWCDKESHIRRRMKR